MEVDDIIRISNFFIFVLSAMIILWGLFLVYSFLFVGVEGTSLEKKYCGDMSYDYQIVDEEHYNCCKKEITGMNPNGSWKEETKCIAKKHEIMKGD